MPLTQAITNYALIDSFGVNCHTAWAGPYLTSNYTPTAGVLAALQYIGVHHIRDDWGSEQNNTNRQTVYATLLANGVSVDIVNNSQTQTSINNMVSAAASYITSYGSKAIFALEGANEQDAGFSFNGQTGTAGNVAFQQALWNGVQGNSTLTNAGVSVINLSLAGITNYSNYSNVTNYCNYANVHWYFNGNTPWYAYGNPYNWEGMMADAAASTYCNHQVCFTETGETTTGINANGYGGVDQATQAKHVLCCYMDGQRAGNKKVYIYELADSQNNGATDPESNFGLFDYSWNKKTAATALHNFTSILTAGGTLTGTPGSLNYSVTGLPSTTATIPNGYQMLYQQNDGRFDIIAWVEPYCWSTSTNSEVTASPTSITINFATPQNVSVFDPMVGTASQANYNSITTLTYNIVDHPIIFEVTTPNATTQALTNFSLIDSLGVNTHTAWAAPYLTTNYPTSTTLNALKYLGVNHIRDDFGNELNNSNRQAVLDELLANGIKASFVFTATSSGFTQSQINAAASACVSYISSYGNCIDALEGANEQDSGFTFGSSSGTAGNVAFQQAIWSSVQNTVVSGSTTLAGSGVKVVAPSMAGTSTNQTSYSGSFTSYADYGNVHWYWNSTGPWYNSAGYSWTVSTGYAQDSTVGKPVNFTEVGLTTIGGDDSTHSYGGVDQLTAAKQLLNAYMDGQRDGNPRTYIYELVDSRNNGATDPESNFGLFDYSWNKKTAANAIHNFTSILSAGGVRQSATNSLQYTISGLPGNVQAEPNGYQILYQQADGRFDIVVWIEANDWSRAYPTGSEITVSPTSITLQLGSNYNINVYDPILGTTAQATSNNSNTITYNVVDYPIIFELTPPSSGGSGGNGNQAVESSYLLGPAQRWWTCPAGVTSVTVECWGAGGGGYTNGGGGGGGAYSKGTVSVTPGTTYTVVVGSHGTGGTTPTAGGATYFNSSTTINANGGSPGTSSAGGAGGITGTTGVTVYAGGAGSSSGGAGGGAGPFGIGGAGSGSTGGTGGNASGGAGGTSGNAGSISYDNGGGGGGSSGAGGLPAGGGGRGANGADGLIKISWAVSGTSNISQFVIQNSSTTNLSGSWFCPFPGINSVTVACWGGGGGGAGGTTGGGGGGGAYAQISSLNITNGALYNYQVGGFGNGGSSGAGGTAGGNTWFSSSSVVSAAGGAGGGTSTGGAGGLASNSVGTTVYSGGNGSSSGGAGGSAGPDGPGGNASGTTGGTADNGNVSASGITNVLLGGSGGPVNNYGGSVGGGGGGSTSGNGYSAGFGQIVITVHPKQNYTTIYTHGYGIGYWTVPVGINNINVQCWGGGGSSASTTDGGAGGGSYASSQLAVTPGTTYQFQVGAAGTGGANGQSTWFISSTTINAPGGGGTSSTSGGSGGSGAIGTITYNGGNGATAAQGGGGGGSAGPDGVGGSSTSSTGGTGDNGNVAGGTSGNTGISNFPLGGGGGGFDATGGYPGGGAGAGAAGRGGKIIISYPSSTPTYQVIIFSNSNTTWYPWGYTDSTIVSAGGPPGVTSYTVNVQCWGAGGGGAGSGYGYGGGGGAYASKIYQLNASSYVTYQIGTGGTGATGTAYGNTGGSTWFGSTANVLAAGGGGNGAGGLASSSVGSITYNGGSDTGQFHYGGGAAGPDGAGGNSFGYSNGGVGDNGNGGNGATGTAGSPGGNSSLGGGGGGDISSGTAGTGGYPGGGGGGTTTTGGTGGTGGTGQIIVTLAYAGLSSNSINTYTGLCIPSYNAFVKAQATPRILSTSRSTGKAPLTGLDFSSSSMKSLPKPIVTLRGSSFPVTILKSTPSGRTSIYAKSIAVYVTKPNLAGKTSLKGSVFVEGRIVNNGTYYYYIPRSHTLSTTALYTTVIPSAHMTMAATAISSIKSVSSGRTPLSGSVDTLSKSVSIPLYKALISGAVRTISTAPNNFFGSIKLLTFSGGQTLSRLTGGASSKLIVPLNGVAKYLTTSVGNQLFSALLNGRINSSLISNLSPAGRVANLVTKLISTFTSTSVTSGKLPLFGSGLSSSAAPQTPLISLFMSGTASAVSAYQGLFTKLQMIVASVLSKTQQSSSTASYNAYLKATSLNTLQSYNAGKFSIPILASYFAKTVASVAKYGIALSGASITQATQKLTIRTTNITAALGGIVNSILTAPQTPLVNRPLTGLGKLVSKAVGPSNNNLNFIFLPSRILSATRAFITKPKAKAALFATSAAMSQAQTNGTFKTPLLGKTYLKTIIRTLQPSTANLLKLAARLFSIPARSKAQQTSTAKMSAITDFVSTGFTSNFANTFLSSIARFTTGLGSYVALPPVLLAANVFASVVSSIGNFIPYFKFSSTTATSNTSATINPIYYALLKTQTNSTTQSKITMANNLASMMSSAFTNIVTKSPFKLAAPMAGRVAQGVLRLASPSYIHGIGLKAVARSVTRLVLNNGLTSNTGILLKAVTGSASYTKTPLGFVLKAYLRGATTNKGSSRNTVSGKGKLYGRISTLASYISTSNFVGISRLIAKIRSFAAGVGRLGGILSMPSVSAYTFTSNKAGTFRYRVAFVANLFGFAQSANILRSTRFILGRTRSVAQGLAISPLSVLLKAILRSKTTSQPPIVGNTLLIVKTETLLAAKAQATPQALLQAQSIPSVKGRARASGVANIMGFLGVVSTTVSDTLKRIWSELTSDILSVQDQDIFVFPVIDSETVTSRDENVGVHVYNLSTTEVGVASDTILGRLRASISVLESGSATDTESAVARFIELLFEQGIVNAVQSAINRSSPQLTEYGNSADKSSAFQIFAALLNEAGTATDVVSRNILEQCLEQGLAEDIVAILLYAFDPLYYVVSQPRVYEITQAYPGPREALAQPFKDPSERLNLIFNFTNSMASFENIGSINSITVQVYYGTDASPSAMLLGSPLILNSKSVQQTIVGGLNGVTYKVKMLINSSLGQVLCLTATVSVATQ